MKKNVDQADPESVKEITDLVADVDTLGELLRAQTGFPPKCIAETMSNLDSLVEMLNKSLH